MNANTKWLTGLVAFLVLINIALLTFIWLKKGSGQPPLRGDARDYLIKELSLNESQVKSFDNLRKGHFEKVHQYREQMRELKDSFFNQLQGPRNAQTDTLAQRIGGLQTKLDLETFDHFSQLRALLNGEQIKKFDQVIQEVLRTMGPGEGPPPPKGGLHPGPPPLGSPPR